MAAGGTPRMDAMPVSPYGPTVPARPPERRSATPPMPFPTRAATAQPQPQSTTAARSSDTPPERPRRAAVVLVAGLLALALALVGLTSPC